MTKEIISIAIMEAYIGPLKKLIEKKAGIYLALSERDQFAMSDDEARRHQRRIDDLVREIELLDNVSQSIEDLQHVYHQQLHLAELALTKANHDITELTKDHITLSQMYWSDHEYQQFLHNYIIQTTRRTS